MPVFLATRVPGDRNRLTVAFRIILVIPQVIVLIFVELAALIVAIIGWFAALVTGRLPEFARNYLAGTIRWGARVHAYFLLLTDEYPPFSLEVEERYPIQVAIPPAAPLNRIAVLFRIILVLPAAVVQGVLNAGAELFAIASWFAILFTGQLPPALFEAQRAVVRYEIRVSSYFWMVTPEYPAAVMGDTTPPGAVDEAWLIRLSPQGRTALTVLIVLGVILSIVNYARVL
jgi:hypothetical protein